MNIILICVFSSTHLNFLDVHRLTDTLMSLLQPTWQLWSCKNISLARSKLTSKPSGFIGGTPPLWEVEEQVPHQQAYDGEDFGWLALQGIFLDSSTSIPLPSSFKIYSSCFVANYFTHFCWINMSQLRLKPLRSTSPLILIGMHIRLSYALMSMLIIGGLFFGTKPSSFILAISLTSLLPKVITSWSRGGGFDYQARRLLHLYLILYFFLFPLSWSFP